MGPWAVTSTSPSPLGLARCPPVPVQPAPPSPVRTGHALPQPAELWPLYHCSQRLLASSPHHLSARIHRRIKRSLPGGPSGPCADFRLTTFSSFRPHPPPTLSSGATCTTHPPRPPPWIPLGEWRHHPPSGQLPKQPLESHPGLLPLCTMASCSSSCSLDLPNISQWPFKHTTEGLPKRQEGPDGSNPR
nr:uncharacterized protein LOC131763562 [Kogia breviceps]